MRTAIRTGRRRGGGRIGLALILVVLVVGAGPGCAQREGPAPIYEPDGPAPAGFYRIRYGDTLGQIAERLGIGLTPLAAWNGLEPPYPIEAGRLLRIVPPQRKPAAARRPDAPSIKRAPDSASPSTAPARKSSEARHKERPGPDAVGLSWQWPLSGRVVQAFRAGDPTRQGIRIAGRPGQLVAAAAAGTVVFSGGGLKGYGNLIIIRHNKNYLTAYGFNRRLLVAQGVEVRRGQSIAEVGQAAAGAPQLHFEIRKDGVAVDPLDYLPQSR